jgi:DTW domain-containing protein YfiP
MNKEIVKALENWVTTQPQADDCEDCKQKYAYCFCAADAEQAYADTIQELRS